MTKQQSRGREVRPRWDSSALRPLVARWAALQQSDETAAAVQAWSEPLREGSEFWTLCGAAFGEAYSRYLESVSCLARRMLSPLPPQAPEALRKWAAWASEIAAAWPPAESAAWERLIVELVEQGNRLADAIVAVALADAIEGVGLPRSVSASLYPLLQPALAWLKTTNLPPAPRSCPDATGYLLLGGVSSSLERLYGYAQQLVERLMAAETMLARAMPPSADRTVLVDLRGQVRELTRARDRWSAILTAAGQGWPVEQASLQAAADGLGNGAASLARLPHPLLKPVAREVRSWTEQFQQHVQELIQGSSASGGAPSASAPSACATKPGEPAEVVRVLAHDLVFQAAGAAEEETAPSNADRASGGDQTVAAGHRGTPSNHDVPGSRPAAAPSATATGAATTQGSTAPRVDGVAHDDVRLAGLAQQLGGESDETAQSFAKRIAGLAAVWPVVRSSRPGAPSRAEAARQLVGCLVSLDQLIAAAGRLGWAVAARDGLRELLTEEGSYCVLESELLGRELADCEDRAVAVALIVASHVSSGCIAEVRQPGYALAASGGGMRVLQKARVILAK